MSSCLAISLQSMYEHIETKLQQELGLFQLTWAFKPPARKKLSHLSDTFLRVNDRPVPWEQFFSRTKKCLQSKKMNRFR
jgi:hypothetical protein